MKISANLFEAFSKCATKGWLVSIGAPTVDNAYSQWAKSQNELYRTFATGRLESKIPRMDSAVSLRAEDLKTDRWRIAFNLVVKAQTNACGLETEVHAIERRPVGRRKESTLTPIRFIFTNKISRDDKLLLGLDLLVISEMLGREVSLGKIIHGDNHATITLKTAVLCRGVRRRIETISELLSKATPPDLALNRHCSECEFQSRCRQKALEQNDLSLLPSMSTKERQKFHKKGIFTVTQLSYTFRPRRRSKRLRDKREQYHHSVKALAIREKKIHIVGKPDLKIEGTPVYLDVEGLPDQDFYYLIGARIGDNRSAVQHSLWANTREDEEHIWRDFLAILGSIENPVLLHYGSFETRFLKRMSKQYGGPEAGSATAKTIEAAINVLSVIFAQVYFPTYSNGLKDVANTLGFKWSDPLGAGARAVVLSASGAAARARLSRGSEFDLRVYRSAKGSPEPAGTFGGGAWQMATSLMVSRSATRSTICPTRYRVCRRSDRTSTSPQSAASKASGVELAARGAGAGLSGRVHTSPG
jgi:predicted RecB family nuclease